MDGSGRKAGVSTKKNVRRRKDVLRGDLMTDINNAHVRIAAEDDAFHCRNIIVGKSEVGQ